MNKIEIKIRSGNCTVYFLIENFRKSLNNINDKAITIGLL